MRCRSNAPNSIHSCVIVCTVVFVVTEPCGSRSAKLCAAAVVHSQSAEVLNRDGKHAVPTGPGFGPRRKLKAENVCNRGGCGIWRCASAGIWDEWGRTSTGSSCCWYGCLPAIWILILHTTVKQRSAAKRLRCVTTARARENPRLR